MSINAPQIHDKTPGETRLVAIDMRGVLDGTQDDDDVWTGEVCVTPALVSFSPSTVSGDNFAVANFIVNTAILVVNGETVPIGCAIQCTVAGGTVGYSYTVIVTCTSNSSPAQTIQRGFKVNVI